MCIKTAIALEVKQEILERVKKGEKVPELGKQYGISEKTIYYWLRVKAIGTLSLLAGISETQKRKSAVGRCLKPGMIKIAFSSNTSGL